MKVKDIIDVDFTNYKDISMFIALGNCNWKCCKEANIPITVCQNNPLAQQKDIDISVNEIFHRYTSNLITSSIVIGGLEPLTIWNDIINLITYFRDNGCLDTFVIYTGYYDYEIKEQIEQIKPYGNIIMKFGRFIFNDVPIFDNVLGVKLASNNQYAERIC